MTDASGPANRPVLGPTQIDDDSREFTLLGLTNIVLAYRRLIIGLPLVLAVVVVANSMLAPRQYIAKSALTGAATSPASSRLSGLAAQFGISVAPPSGAETAEFFRQLLLSREILRQVAETEYAFRDVNGDSVRGTYIEIEGIEGETPNAVRLNSIRALEGAISATSNFDSNIITLTVRARSPDLARQMNRRMLELADDYNAQRRRSQAGEERRFVEAQLTAARGELEKAEREMELFLESNRRFEDSPQLMYERQRLQRRLDQREQVFASLAQAFEQARVDEVRNTPVISIITPPETVVEPMSRGTTTKGMLALIAGTIIALAIAFTRVTMDRKRSAKTEDYTAFVQLRQDTVEDVLQVLPDRVRARVRIPWMNRDRVENGTEAPR
ncbi:MAG TPA: hypothetical protein VK928_00375 [Longimicrobiales bacterium]|nr:hypothetical protein [Longimicrobiales bacterium]